MICFYAPNGGNWETAQGIPDTFAQGSQTLPDSIEAFQRFNLAQTRRDGGVVARGVSLSWQSIKDLFQMFQNGLTPKTFFLLLRQLIREVLNKKRKKIAEKEITKLTQVKLYANLTGIEKIPITRVRGMLGAWNNFFLLGKIFTFLFKFYNNSLGLNSRVAKFNNTVDPGCTVLFVV